MQPSALTTLGYMVTAVSLHVRHPAAALARHGAHRAIALPQLACCSCSASQSALIHNTGNWPLIIPPIIVGAVIGAVSARLVRMTAMPQMVALFNGMGGGSAALIAAQDYRTAVAHLTATPDITWAIMVSCIIGSLSFAGSMVAFAKLQELMPGRPLTYRLQSAVNGLMLVVILAIGVYLVVGDQMVDDLQNSGRTSRSSQRSSCSRCSSASSSWCRSAAPTCR